MALQNEDTLVEKIADALAIIDSTCACFKVEVTNDAIYVLDKYKEFGNPFISIVPIMLNKVTIYWMEDEGNEGKATATDFEGVLRAFEAVIEEFSKYPNREKYRKQLDAVMSSLYVL